LQPGIKSIALIAVLALTLAGCQTKNEGSMRASMLITGALVGGFVGYNFFASSDAARVIFGLAGAAAGSYGAKYASDHIIKKDMERRKMAAYQSLVVADEGVPVFWENPETGSSGSFKVLRSYKSAEGRVCRELETHDSGEDGSVTNQQTACQLFNGAWELV
jgi:surface antigen